MCGRHWARVPARIKHAVWAAYRPGQCDDKEVSKEWLTAANAAICAVAKMENRQTSPSERAAYATFSSKPHTLLKPKRKKILAGIAFPENTKEAIAVDDRDGDVETDGDVCDRCGRPRGAHAEEDLCPGFKS